MSEAEVLTRVEGRVGRITLNRPQARALTTPVCRDIAAVLIGFPDDRGIEVVHSRRNLQGVTDNMPDITLARLSPEEGGGRR